MAKVVPSINCHFRDNEAVIARIRAIEELFAKTDTPEEERLGHFDIADGLFTFNKSWDDPERLASMKPNFHVEAHLMVEDPKPAAQRWLSAGARRVIVHLETAPVGVFEEITVFARRTGAEVALALNPETPVGDAVPYFKFTSGFLVMSVHPGFSGQKFLPLVLEKVSFLRSKMPDAKIEIDGGIDPGTASAAVAAGANLLVSDSYIFRDSDPVAAYRKLANIAERKP